MSMRMQVDISRLFELVEEQSRLIAALSDRVTKLESDRTLRLKPKADDRGR